MPEQYSNAPGSTLNAAMLSTDTSLTVASAATFPATGNFRILIDNEYMQVTAVSGNTFTVTRGIEGTTAAAHSAGVAVDGLLTKGALDQIRADNVPTGTFSTEPAAGIQGRIFLPSDGFVAARDTGAAWNNWGPLFPLTPPPNDGNWSFVNQGNTLATFQGGGLYLNVNEAQAAFTQHLYVRTAPATPYTLTLAFIPNLFAMGQGNHIRGGIALYNSTSGKFIMFGFNAQTTQSWNGIEIDQATNTTTLSAQVLFRTGFWSQPLMWFRITDDGTTRTYSLSHDGQNFTKFYSETDTTFITPNQVGIYIGSDTAVSGFPYGITALHWTGA